MAAEDPRDAPDGELRAGWSRSVPVPARVAWSGAGATGGTGSAPAPAVIEPSGVGAILDTALDVLRARFGACLGLSVAVWLPVAAIERALQGIESMAASALVVPILMQLFAQAVVIAVVVTLVYEQLQGRRISAWASLALAARRAPAVLVTALVSQVSIGLGTCCLIAPGVFVAWITAVAPAALVLEGLGPFAALARGARLARGSFGRWLGLVCVQGVLVLPVTSLVGVLSEPQAYDWLLRTSGLAVPVFTLLELALRALLMGLATSFGAVVLTVLYIDFRVRTEGFDLVMRLERLSAAHPAGGRA